MAGRPAARLSDMGSNHGAWHPSPIIQGSADVIVNGMPAARQGDGLAPHTQPNSPPHPRSISGGASTVFINSMPAARVSDAINCGGVIMIGSPNVFIGNDTPTVEALQSLFTFDECFRIVDENGKALVNMPYYIEDQAGNIYKGITDETGLTPRVCTEKAEKLKITLGLEALEKANK